MAYPDYDQKQIKIQFHRQTLANLSSVIDALGVEGELVDVTDKLTLLLRDGTNEEFIDIFGHLSEIVTSDTTLGARHGVVMADASSGTIDLDLPALGTYPNKIYTLIGYDATNTITVNTDSGSEYIKRIKSDTLTSDTLASGDIYKIKDVGTHWQLI